MKKCGTCAWAEPREMSQGELSEIRCGHPTVHAAFMQEEVPDWLIDLNAFHPDRFGQNCGAWRARKGESL